MEGSPDGGRQSRRYGSTASASVRMDEEMTKMEQMLQSWKDKSPPTFVDKEAMKDQVRQKLSKPQYNVFDFYKETGCCQMVAKSPVFDRFVLIVIACNALWIMIDTDQNDSALLMEAKPRFIVAENFFCTVFSVEWFVRFVSFRRKCDGLKDAWFVFDSFMVSMMVLETWIFTTVIAMTGSNTGAGGGNVSVLRIARLLRLSRMARMGKLLRVMPELLIMIKGMQAACRSVFWTLFLLVVIMYVFGIAFVQLSSESQFHHQYFESVPSAMFTLLVFGIFWDGVGKILDDLENDRQHVLVALFLVFVLLGALTVMNMLIGILCEVVSAVSATEREEMHYQHVNEKLTMVMNVLDEDNDGCISKDEFRGILSHEEAVRCMNDVGVDVFALIDLADFIFQDEQGEERELDFSGFMEVILQLRGSNAASVKDILDLRKFMRTLMLEQSRGSQALLHEMKKAQMLTSSMSSRLSTSFSDAFSGTIGNKRSKPGEAKRPEEIKMLKMCFSAMKPAKDPTKSTGTSSKGTGGKRKASKGSKQDVENPSQNDPDLEMPFLPPAGVNEEFLSWDPIPDAELSMLLWPSNDLLLAGAWTAYSEDGVDTCEHINDTRGRFGRLMLSDTCAQLHKVLRMKLASDLTLTGTWSPVQQQDAGVVIEDSFNARCNECAKSVQTMAESYNDFGGAHTCVNVHPPKF